MPIPGGVEVFFLPLIVLGIVLILFVRYVYRWYVQGRDSVKSD